MTTILYIDDNEDDAMIAMHAFADGKIKLKWVSSAAAALQELARNTYDLIVSDMLMPGDDGLDFIKKAESSDIHTPIILASGIPALKSFEKYSGLKNYLGFVLKPITPDKIERFLWKL